MTRFQAAPAGATATPVLSGATPRTGGSGVISEAALLGPLPDVRPVDPATVAEAVRSSGRTLVVLDDDPTGSQTVYDVPVLTTWSVEDLRWALRQNASTFYVLTNTRSLDPDQAAARNQEIVGRLAVAGSLEAREFAVLSRGDSTLRGHYPLETDVIDDVLSERTGRRADGLLLCPAYVDAGRLTVDDVHWMRTADGMLPVGLSEFARDASFGFSSSDLRAFVEERTAGRWRAHEVLSIGLEDIRDGGPERVAELLMTLREGRPAVVNAVCDDDLRVVALATLAAERQGARFLYRTGPSFVRARAGLFAREPLSAAEVYGGDGRQGRGLIVVGSHVSLTTRQLGELRARGGIDEVELEVGRLLDPALRDAHVRSVVERTVDALDRADTVVRTTRQVVTGQDPARSLAIARHVSESLVQIVRAVTATRTPRFVVAKGGITSSDVATQGLGIRRAWVRGTLLPGIVSVWSAVDGAAPGMPYVVFAGNVGDDRALADAVDVLRGDR